MGYNSRCMQAPPRFQSDKLKEKKRRKRTITSVVYVVLFVVLLGGLTYFSHHPKFRIEQVIVSDLLYTDRAAVELTIKEQLSGRYLGLFSKANSFMLPRRSIARSIMDQHPAVHDVDVDVRGLRVVAVRLTEYAPVAKWCDTPVTPATTLAHAQEEEVEGALPQVVTDRNGVNCFLVNDKAIVFARSPQNQEVEGLVTFFGRIVEDPIRQSYTDEEQFTDLLDFTRLLRRLEINVKEVWTTNGEAFALVTEPGALLYIERDDSIVDVFTNLQTVIDRDAINKAQFANIAYIDLRFGNRVFYKLK